MRIQLFKKILVFRLILSLALLLAVPAAAQAAWLNFDSLNKIDAWVKEKITLPFWQKKARPIFDHQSLSTVDGLALVAVNLPLVNVAKVYDITVTAYSSSMDETDDTPLITASGAWVGDGVAASNFLPFGTQIKIPEVFGSKIFIIKDRMAPKHSDKIDIWFESKELAKTFGAKKAQIQVLESVL